MIFQSRLPRKHQDRYRYKEYILCIYPRQSLKFFYRSNYYLYDKKATFLYQIVKRATTVLEEENRQGGGADDSRRNVGRHHLAVRWIGGQEGRHVGWCPTEGRRREGTGGVLLDGEPRRGRRGVRQEQDVDHQRQVAAEGLGDSRREVLRGSAGPAQSNDLRGGAAVAPVEEPHAIGVGSDATGAHLQGDQRELIAAVDVGRDRVPVHLRIVVALDVGLEYGVELDHVKDRVHDAVSAYAVHHLISGGDRVYANRELRQLRGASRVAAVAVLTVEETIEVVVDPVVADLVLGNGLGLAETFVAAKLAGQALAAALATDGVQAADHVVAVRHALRLAGRGVERALVRTAEVAADHPFEVRTRHPPEEGSVARLEVVENTVAAQGRRGHAGEDSEEGEVGTREERALDTPVQAVEIRDRADGEAGVQDALQQSLDYDLAVDVDAVVSGPVSSEVRPALGVVDRGQATTDRQAGRQ